MEFQEVIEKRFSVREYLDKPVEDEKIHAILESARLAPTGKNSQPQYIYVIKSKQGLEKVKQLTKCAFNSPIVFLICANKEKEVVLLQSGTTTLVTDVSIVQTHMMLKATDLGLGSCWVARFLPEDAKKLFNIPSNLMPTGLLFVGYYASDVKPLNMHNESVKIEDFTEFI